MALLTAGLIMSSCGSVALTGRKQLLLVSDQEVYQAGLTQYNEYIASSQLSSDTKNTAIVKNVGQKLAAATEQYLRANGLESELKNFAWEFNLVKDKQVNAFCMPGGKIVVYEGLLTVAQTEAELAVVIGHEIAHAILSQALSQKSAAIQQTASTVFGLGAQVGLMLPYSRKHEYEADYMGIVFMELAGYDSTSSIDFWTKMSAGSSGGSDFLSTHPSDTKRIAELQRRIPEAKQIAQSM